MVCRPYPLPSQLQNYTGEQVLLVADPEEMYGMNWYICLTPDASKAIFDVRVAQQSLNKTSSAAHTYPQALPNCRKSTPRLLRKRRLKRRPRKRRNERPRRRQS